MTNYFESVGTKSSLISNKDLNLDDGRLDLLLKFRDDSDVLNLESHLEEVDKLYTDWCDRLFEGYNIVIYGRQSKFRLLETFKKRYLDSNKIPDLEDESAMSNLNITTVRLHGFTPITIQQFQHVIFKHSTREVFNPEKELDSFLSKLRSSRIHFVFLIHSFDLFIRECKKVCQLIFQMFRLEPTKIHLLVSGDHINSPKILHSLKHQLNLIFYHVPYGNSFYYERINNVDVIDQQAGKTNNMLTVYHGILDLQSIKDVYQALQQACQSIMLYIFEHHLGQLRQFELNKHAGVKRKKPAAGRRVTRQATMFDKDQDCEAVEEFEMGLDFGQLLKYCGSRFIVRRSGLLRNQLGELVDHRLIKLDESSSKIECLVNKDTCEKFLEHIKSLNNKDE